jgi:uncharacterized Zn-finger protein
MEYVDESLTRNKKNIDAEQKLTENPEISLSLNEPEGSGAVDITNVDYQTQHFYNDADLEEVEEMQTQIEDGNEQYTNSGAEQNWTHEDGLYDSQSDATADPHVPLSFTTDEYNEMPPTRIQLFQQQQYNSAGNHMSGHVNQIHLIPTQKSKKPNKCKLCPAAFTLKRTLLMHMVTFHKTPQHQLTMIQPSVVQEDPNSYNSYSANGNNGKPQKRLFCRFPHCTKSYASTQNLKIHMRTHTGERPHVCNICQKAFADPSCLRRHTIYFHGVPGSTEVLLK